MVQELDETGEPTVEDSMARLEAIPHNKKILKQIGVRESMRRCLAAKNRFAAQEEMKDPRILGLITSLWGFEMSEVGPS